jgi:glutamate-1-semialdehyde 2,1-aminomutase
MVIAVRIARAYTGKDKVAFCGYHGWHDWYLAANLGTENALGEHLISGLNPAGVPKGLAGTAYPFRYNQLDELKEIVSKNKNDLGVIVMESIRGDEPTKEFIQGVRTIATEIGAVLIVDEISAGFRMNTGGAHLKLKLVPDIAVFSKALGNGYPIAAIIGKGHIMDAAQSTFISSTNWTERIGPTAALKMLEIHQRDNVSDHLIRMGTKVQKGWTSLAEKNQLSIDVGGIPPLSHFSFNTRDSNAVKALFIQLMLERGFLASNSFYSMFSHTDEHLDAYLKSVDSSFITIKQALDQDNVNPLLKGKPSASGFKRLA